jgi:hypothetical protein
MNSKKYGQTFAFLKATGEEALQRKWIEKKSSTYGKQTKSERWESRETRQSIYGTSSKLK